MGFLGSWDGKESACNAGDRRCRFNATVGKILWRREWLPTPVFLLGEFQGQRNLVGYSPWGPKELDMTERLHFYSFTFPSGSVGKTPCFQCRGVGLIPGPGTKFPHAPRCGQKVIFIHNRSRLETTKCPSTNEWRKKLWSIHTMEYP